MKLSVTLRQRTLKSGRVTLYLDIYTNGIRKTESLNLYLVGERKADKETLRLANIIRARREEELLATSANSLTKGDAMFLPTYKQMANRVAPGTRKIYIQAVNALREVCEVEQLRCRDITPKLLEAYSAHLSKRYKASTARLLQTSLTVWCNFALKKGFIAVNPSLNIERIRVEQTHREFLTEEELRRMIATMDTTNVMHRAFIFACLTGLRYSDIIRVRYEDIVDGVITLRQQKTNEVVYIPLTDDVSRLIEPLAHEGLVFGPLVASTLMRKIRRWAQKAGITKRISMHTARHTFAVLLLTKGVDIYTVSRLLGHRNVKTTQIYADIVDERRKEAIKKLPKLL